MATDSEKKYYNETIVPLVMKRQKHLTDEKVDIVDALIAVATMLALALHKVNDTSLFSKLLAAFIAKNIQELVAKRTRESN